jgi:hypothetical protein
MILDPESRERAKRFWIRSTVGVVGGGILITVLVHSWGAIRHRLVALFPMRSASDQFAEEMNREIAARSKFDPKTDTIYKPNYVDNAIYTEHYLDMKLDEASHKRWILELNQFFLSDLHLDEKAIVKFSSSEVGLIHKLVELKGLINAQYQEEGIQRMRDVETSYYSELTSELGGSANLERVRRFERAFYERWLLERGGRR